MASFEIAIGLFWFERRSGKVRKILTIRLKNILMLEKAPCPKCRSALCYVTALPHPKAPQMRKTTFVCQPCNRTWTYALTAEIAELYAADSSFELSA